MDKVQFPYRSSSHLVLLHVVAASGGWQRQGLDVSQLDKAMGQLRNLTDPKLANDPRTVNDLRTNTVQEMEEFEFGLRKSLIDVGKNGAQIGTTVGESGHLGGIGPASGF